MPHLKQLTSVFEHYIGECTGQSHSAPPSRTQDVRRICESSPVGKSLRNAGHMDRQRASATADSWAWAFWRLRARRGVPWFRWASPGNPKDPPISGVWPWAKTTRNVLIVGIDIKIILKIHKWLLLTYPGISLCSWWTEIHPTNGPTVSSWVCSFHGATPRWTRPVDVPPPMDRSRRPAVNSGRIPKCPWHTRADARRTSPNSAPKTLHQHPCHGWARAAFDPIRCSSRWSIFCPHRRPPVRCRRRSHGVRFANLNGK